MSPLIETRLATVVEKENVNWLKRGKNSKGRKPTKIDEVEDLKRMLHSGPDQVVVKTYEGWMPRGEASSQATYLSKLFMERFGEQLQTRGEDIDQRHVRLYIRLAQDGSET